MLTGRQLPPGPYKHHHHPDGPQRSRSPERLCRPPTRIPARGAAIFKIILRANRWRTLDEPTAAAQDRPHIATGVTAYNTSAEIRVAAKPCAVLNSRQDVSAIAFSEVTTSSSQRYHEQLS